MRVHARVVHSGDPQSSDHLPETVGTGANVEALPEPFQLNSLLDEPIPISRRTGLLAQPELEVTSRNHAVEADVSDLLVRDPLLLFPLAPENRVVKCGLVVTSI